MKINTKLNIGDKIYRINNAEKTIGFVSVDKIEVSVMKREKEGLLGDKCVEDVSYLLSNGDKVLENDITEENNYYINIKSAGEALDELF